MNQRVFIIGACAFAVLAFALVVALARRAPSDGDPRAAAPTPAVALGDSSETTTTRPDGGFERSAVARDANTSAPSLNPRAPLAPGDNELVENALPDNSVFIEVRVLTPSETSPLFPHPYAGGIVHVTARASSADSDTSNRAPIESDGIARFRFEGPVHVTWFRAEHRRVLGRVTTLDGLALPVIELAAYAEKRGIRERWTDDGSPAHFAVRSGASGEFEFPALPKGRVYILVRPGEWLQLAPHYAGEFNERAWLDVELGESFDEARFGDQLKLLAEIAETTPVWPSSAEGWVTDRDGRARGHVLAGDWELRVRPQLGADADVSMQVVKLPASEVVVRLPSRLVDVDGRVVEAGGRTPIGNVSLAIQVDGLSHDTRSDEHGRFRFASLCASAGFRLSATHLD